jgi:hypothetical protein
MLELRRLCQQFPDSVAPIGVESIVRRVRKSVFPDSWSTERAALPTASTVEPVERHDQHRASTVTATSERGESCCICGQASLRSNVRPRDSVGRCCIQIVKSSVRNYTGCCRIHETRSTHLLTVSLKNEASGPCSTRQQSFRARTPPRRRPRSSACPPPLFWRRTKRSRPCRCRS